MSPAAYAYQVDQAGLIRSSRTEAPDGAVARFDLGGIWSRRSTIPQAQGSDQRDLLRVAAAVAAADRLSSRWIAGGNQTSHQVRWQREIHLDVAVEEPQRWEGACARATEVLVFLTGDDWRLRFSPVERPSVQGLLWRDSYPTPPEVALFSGGLDSAAGLLARHLQGCPHLLAVSVSGTTVRETAQRRAIRHLRHQGVKVNWLPVVHQLQKRPAAHPSPADQSRRTRGFLFLAVGAVAASVVGAKRLFVYESGIGALNLRTVGSQVAAETTRAMHPRTLLLMEELFTQVLEDSISIELPFIFSTKREVCHSLGPKLTSLAQVTMSCDEGEGHKADSMEHCGLCTSCLFRRVALHGAPDPTKYRCTPRGDHSLYDLSAFEMQALLIREWDRGFESLVCADPEARHALLYAARHGIATDKARTGLAAAYERYAGEVAEFVRNARPTISPATPLSGREVQHALFAGTR